MQTEETPVNGTHCVTWLLLEKETVTKLILFFSLTQELKFCMNSKIFWQLLKNNPLFEKSCPNEEPNIGNCVNTMFVVPPCQHSMKSVPEYDFKISTFSVYLADSPVCWVPLLNKFSGLLSRWSDRLMRSFRAEFLHVDFREHLVLVELSSCRITSSFRVIDIGFRNWVQWTERVLCSIYYKNCKVR